MNKDKELNILITNDDGIMAEGLFHLTKAAKKLGKVTVLAPENQCSAMSHRITVRRPMELKAVDISLPDVKAYSLEGMPADCVKAGIHQVCDTCPDLVLSGINKGFNMGFDVLYSGTVNAAMEALLNQVPAIAVSAGRDADWDTIDKLLPSLLLEALQRYKRKNEVVNINFPKGEIDSEKEIMWDIPVAPMQIFSDYKSIHLSHMDGKTYITEEGPQITLAEAIPGTDAFYVLSGHITVGTIPCVVIPDEKN